MSTDEQARLADAINRLNTTLTEAVVKIDSLKAYCERNIEELWKKHDVLAESHQRVKTKQELNLREWDEHKRSELDFLKSDRNPGSLSDRRMVWISGASVLVAVAAVGLAVVTAFIK